MREIRSRLQWPYLKEASVRSIPLLAVAFVLLTPVFCAPAVSAQEDLGVFTREAGMRGLRIDSVFAPFDNPRSPGCAVGVLEEGRL
ncbi:MAG: hypothetical protein MUO50_00665, partial [Longimicrobiales bacterium]|nr:hypothetical protein [Longimicrobiales bacterium]